MVFGFLSSYLMPHLWREDEPDSFGPVKYHQEFGFEDRLQDRQAKTTTATEDEMNAAGLEPHLRNECAYWHIRYRGCIYQNRPLWYRCTGIRREINHCYLKERIDDMKEFERERRLNVRERRLRELEARS